MTPARGKSNTVADRMAAKVWAPFCLVCSTMGRMTPIPGGWKCEGKGDHFGRVGCGNEIDYDLLPARSAIQRAGGEQQ